MLSGRLHPTSLFPAQSSVYIFCLFVGLLYPKNVKTAEAIGSKFFVAPYVIPGNVYE